MLALRVMVAALALTSVACSADVVGSWSTSSTCGKWSLDVADDNTATATIQATNPVDSQCLKLSFEAEWDDVGNGWEFEMDCKKGGCKMLYNPPTKFGPGSFSMFCEFPEEDEEKKQMPCIGRFPQEGDDPETETVTEEVHDIFTTIGWTRAN